MTFVTCTQFKNSQAAQDEKLNALEACCQKGTEKNAEQDKAISALQNGALSADDALVDKAGVSDGQGKGTGKITVAKIKKAIEGDLAVAVDAKKGLSGNGKNSEPLAVNAKAGDFKFNAQTGALELGGNALQAGNIGNGLKYDPDTGKYGVDVREANGVKTNPDGSVGLAVSPDAGNLIQLRPNGVYYGITPEASVASLYVSLSGSDSNDGSRGAPFRTVKKALDTIATSKQQGYFYVHLKAGETFSLVDDNVWLGSGQYFVEFRYFDDPHFGDAYSHDGWYPSASKELSRPTLVFDTYRVGSVVRSSGFNAGILENIVFHGVNVTINNSAGATSGGGNFFYSNRMDFQGSDITINGDHVGIGSAVNILLRQCNFFLNGTAKPFISDFTPQLFWQELVAPDASVTEPNGSLVATGRTHNTKAVLKADNTMALAAYDRNTKTLFGWGANWDIFV